MLLCALCLELVDVHFYDESQLLMRYRCPDCAPGYVSDEEAADLLRRPGQEVLRQHLRERVKELPAGMVLHLTIGHGADGRGIQITYIHDVT